MRCRFHCPAVSSYSRDGTMYCSKGANSFMESLLDEFLCDFPDMPLYLRGDSGFASPDLYEVLEEKNCKYAIFCTMFPLDVNTSY